MRDFSAKVDGTLTNPISHGIGLGRGKDRIEKGLRRFAVTKSKVMRKGGDKPLREAFGQNSFMKLFASERRS